MADDDFAAAVVGQARPGDIRLPGPRKRNKLGHGYCMALAGYCMTLSTVSRNARDKVLDHARQNSYWCNEEERLEKKERRRKRAAKREAEGYEPHLVFMRPCVDCGLLTGCYCDLCLTSECYPCADWQQARPLVHTSWSS